MSKSRTQIRKLVKNQMKNIYNTLSRVKVRRQLPMDQKGHGKQFL